MASEKINQKKETIFLFNFLINSYAVDGVWIFLGTYDKILTSFYISQVPVEEKVRNVKFDVAATVTLIFFVLCRCSTRCHFRKSLM